MKKLLLCVFVGLLAACNNTVKPVESSDSLVVINYKPKSCVYLYKMSTSAEFYSRDDAVQYLKNQVVAQNKSGNVIWLEQEEKVQKDWVMFGPEYKYNMTARVYDCPNLEQLKK